MLDSLVRVSRRVELKPFDANILGMYIPNLTSWIILQSATRESQKLDKQTQASPKHDRDASVGPEL